MLKRASYPSGRSAGVYLQLGGYEDRHGEKCHLPFPLAALTLLLLLCEVVAAGDMREVLPPAPPVLPPHPPSPTAKGEDDPGVQERDENISLFPHRVNQSHRHWYRLHRGGDRVRRMGSGGGSSLPLRLLQTPLISPVLSPSLACSLPISQTLKLSQQDKTRLFSAKVDSSIE